MPGNNFEKQVHTIMDDFKLHPSTEVWPKVKSRIAKRKRRRFIFFMLPVATALILAGIFAANEMATGDNTDKVTVGTAPVKSPDMSASIHDSLNQHHATATHSQESGDQQNATGNKMHEKNMDQKIMDQKINNENSILTLNSTRRSVTGSLPFIKDSLGTTIPAANRTENLAVESITSMASGDEPVHNRYTETIQLIPVPATSAQHTLLKPNVFTGSVQPIAAADAASKKMEWNIHASGGISKTSNGRFTNVFSSEEKADMANAPNTGGGPGGPNTRLQYPKNGNSFSLGVSLQKRFLPRSSLLAGIQYFYASDAIKAGVYRDTTVSLQNTFSSRANGYYTGNSTWYTNRYHFIELPVSYQYMANRYKKIPVQLQATISYSYLLATNALVYDPANAGIYFSDNKQFNRSSVYVGSAVLFQLINSKKMSWSIGPQFRSSISPLRKSEFDPNKFLSSGSIRMNIQLH